MNTSALRTCCWGCCARRSVSPLNCYANKASPWTRYGSRCSHRNPRLLRADLPSSPVSTQEALGYVPRRDRCREARKAGREEDQENDDTRSQSKVGGESGNSAGREGQQTGHTVARLVEPNGLPIMPDNGPQTPRRDLAELGTAPRIPFSRVRRCDRHPTDRRRARRLYDHSGACPLAEHFQPAHAGGGPRSAQRTGGAVGRQTNGLPVLCACARFWPPAV